MSASPDDDMSLPSYCSKINDCASKVLYKVNKWWFRVGFPLTPEPTSVWPASKLVGLILKVIVFADEDKCKDGEKV